MGVPIYVVTFALFGALLGWLWLASGSVLPPTVAHSAYNNAFVIPAVLYGHLDHPVAGTLSTPVGWAVMLVALLALQRSGALPRAIARWREARVQAASVDAGTPLDQEARAAEGGAATLEEPGGGRAQPHARGDE